jgi:O-acetyl-ADP-ribose deacetylase (regulator of RNase III)
MQLPFGHGQIELLLGDITHQQVDAIVNAANTRLAGGSGVDGAIHQAAGPGLLEACQQLAAKSGGERCPTGEARSTPAFDLSADWVIHTVGPVYDAQQHELCCQQLADAFRSSFKEARRLGCNSVAVPAISTGVYRFPLSEAARIALAAARQFLLEDAHPATIRFVLFGQIQWDAFAAEMAQSD